MFNSRGAVQSALIGAELSLKGGLSAVGADKKAIRKHGHNLESAAKAFGLAKPDFDLQRILAVVGHLPAYVENRYSPSQTQSR